MNAAVDMTGTILAKSDQLNSDDLMGRSITITITKVGLLAGDQPVAISYDGDQGKPWKPSKGMRRVLVHNWGSDGNRYIGRSLTLFRDEKVAFGGLAVGGIRISHMSDIDGPVTMSLTASRASKKPFTVQPLGEVKKTIEASPEQKKAAAKKKADGIVSMIAESKNDSVLADILEANKDIIARLENGYSELSAAIKAAVDLRRNEFDVDAEETELPV